MEFFLDKVVSDLPQFKQLNVSLEPKSCVFTSGLTSVHKANIISSLCHTRNVRAFCVASDEKEAQILCNDLSCMGKKAFVYPIRDFNFRNVSGKSNEYEHSRLKVLQKIIAGDFDVVIACIDAACQFTVPKEYLSKAVLSIKPGDEITTEKCVTTLTLLGYQRFAQVDGKGQFSLRGGILDFFMPESENPVRVEFWGDEVDSVNYFDLETQRRIESIDEVLLTPSTEILIDDYQKLCDKIKNKASLLTSEKSAMAKEILFDEAQAIADGVHLSNYDKYISLIYDKSATLFDYFTDDELFFISEYKTVTERAKAYEYQFKLDLEDYIKDGVLCRGLDNFSISFNECLEIFKEKKTVILNNFSYGNINLPLTDTVGFNLKQLGKWNGSVSVLCEDLDSISYIEKRCVVLGGTKKAAQNLVNSLTDKGYNACFFETLSEVPKGVVCVLEGSLSSGVEIPSLDFYLYSYGEFNFTQVKKTKKKKNGQQIYSLAELSSGDYVVHSTHGIGIFKGVKKLDLEGISKDYIKIDYAKGDVLYVPVTQLDLVAKYIGPKENSGVKLNRLGSQEWQKTKSRVKSAVKDMAKELIELYSQRMKTEGYAFSGDNEWQHDFESKFEYEETADQIRCSKEIKDDMQRSVPMDRLLCGDVGFGKTEVALRGAFKCVTDSKQCALLCPTTILALQHFQTVLKRFDGYPINVQLLSRFRTPKQQQEILKALKRGEIDMVIGTHRLVQKDVEFRDLGLVIIDEEQRFGVAHKERFKEVCKNVDVLTLSATPIPRTLNMALSGIRDMSVIEEAPQNRHPVQTYVLEHDTAIVYEAIRREIRRGGQVFYLHNNVSSISRKADEILQNIPEAKVAVAHGKMGENELSEVWRKMLEQEIQVLVCTTIIETGVDIPNANTLIIENADRFGLSQLHQIRGRIGRSTRRAYAYFTFTGGKVLSEISQKRLTAIREFTEFGSGFKIAMRDLELRGAGNILGAQQHGHMENVGYDMYLKLLEQAVNEEKGEAVSDTDRDCLIDIMVDAHIPERYIGDLSQRLDVYRKISDIRTKDDALDVTDELIDRFGEIPKTVLGLIDIALIRNSAMKNGVYEIKQNANGILLYIDDVKSPFVANILKTLKGNVLISAGSKPYVTVKFSDKKNILKNLKEIF